jgi:hypothetical protein
MEWKLTQVVPPTWQDAVRNPMTSLIAPLDLAQLARRSTQEILAKYGHVFSFFVYLDRFCVNPSNWDLFFRREGVHGWALIEEVMRESRVRECQNAEDFFRAFQRARYFPSPLSDRTMIIPAGRRPAVLPTRPARLPAFSGAAYRMPENGCHSQDVSVPGEGCVRVQYKRAADD